MRGSVYANGHLPGEQARKIRLLGTLSLGLKRKLGNIQIPKNSKIRKLQNQSNFKRNLMISTQKIEA